jgi:uncharacterized membrane protein YqjE
MNSVANGRTLAEVVSDMKEEFKQFAQTRIALLQAELREKSKTLKVAMLLGAVALVLLVTAYLLITLALVGLIATAFANNPYQWVLGFVIVGVLWSVIGGVCAYMAKRDIQARGIVPKRTIEVLKGDKIWLQSEARNQS